MATARAVAAHRRAQVVELATTTDLTYDEIASRVGYAHRGILPGARVGTLDIQVCLAGQAGDGKGTAMDLAARLVPDVDFECICGEPDHAGMYVVVPAGTREGILRAFYDDVAEQRPNGRQVRIPKLDRRHVLVRMDEVQALTALNDGSGATIIPLLRQAFSGEGLGFQYASNEKRRKVPAGGYRLSVLMARSRRWRLHCSPRSGAAPHNACCGYRCRTFAYGSGRRSISGLAGDAYRDLGPRRGGGRTSPRLRRLGRGRDARRAGRAA